MERRAFLSGLFGVAGVLTLGGLTMGNVHAVPIAPLPAAGPEPDGQGQADGHAPDGTPIEPTQYGRRRGYRPRWRRDYRRRWRPRRRSRLVCRTYRVRGRLVRRCRRVGGRW